MAELRHIVEGDSRLIPSPSASDDGKVLKVVSGSAAWSVSEVGGDMNHSEFSSLTTLTNATLNQVANKVNEIINKLKPATAMFMAMLGFATFGDLGPNTQFGNVPPTSTLSEVVTAGGGITVERDPVAVPYVTAVSNKLEVAISAKQNELVSGTNIKTINGQSLLGSGNIVIQGGGGGADTNTVNDLIRSYDETNLTERLDEKVDAKYTWMRPNDWTISYAMSNTSRDVTSSYATIDSSYRVISNIVYSTGYGHAGQAYLTMLDPTSEEKSGIDSFFAVDSGITIDPSSGEFSTFDDGLFKIGARRLGEVRYAEIASQILSNSVSKTDSYYADDVAGTARKMVNDTAISVLYAATFVKSNDYVEVKGGVTNHHRYAVYNTFQPRMTGTGAGNVAPFAVSQHILASCKHYGEWIRWKGNQTFNDGQGHSATVTKLEWVSLSDWAATNGFSEVEIAYADIDDIMLIRCSKATAVPDGCIPYFMTETAMHNIFGESMRGVCAWACTQDLIYAIPVVMENEHTPRRSPSYYDKYEDPSTGILGFSRADACRRLEQMGLQYYVHSGDSGKPIFVNVNGNPVILTAWGYSDHLRNNYVRGYRIIKAFVENYGDTLKGYEL